jgi:hypothetical protein
MMHKHQAGSGFLKIIENFDVFGGWCGKINWGIAAGELQARHVIENDDVVSSRRSSGSGPRDVVNGIKDSKECIGYEWMAASDYLN